MSVGHSNELQFSKRKFFVLNISDVNEMNNYFINTLFPFGDKHSSFFVVVVIAVIAVVVFLIRFKLIFIILFKFPTDFAIFL